MKQDLPHRQKGQNITLKQKHCGSTLFLCHFSLFAKVAHLIKIRICNSFFLQKSSEAVEKCMTHNTKKMWDLLLRKRKKKFILDSEYNSSLT